jgi:hypothetical protein
MKVNIEIDLSPQEARELMGWPDVSEFQSKLMESVNQQLQDGSNENLNAMLQPFFAESQKAFGAYQKMMEGFASTSFNKKD